MLLIGEKNVTCERNYQEMYEIGTKRPGINISM